MHEHNDQCSHSLYDHKDFAADVEASIRRVLVDHGVESTANQGMHDWRCQYPDAYGPCDHFEDLVADLVTVVTMTPPTVRDRLS